MKNQYFGDIGDYGKYGLLRHLAGQGLSISVNWYLTPKDTTNDGSIRGYLSRGKIAAMIPSCMTLCERCVLVKRRMYVSLQSEG